MGGQHINQGYGGIFHVVYDTIDFCNDIVIEHLKDDGDDQTEYRGQKGHLDIPGDQGGTQVTDSGDFLEGHDHPDHRTHEPEHGRSGDEQGQPGNVLLKLAHLYAPIGDNGLFCGFQSFFRSFKTLVKDGGNGPLGGPADLLGGFNPTGGQGVLNALLQFFGVGGCHVQIDDPFNGNGQSQNQTEQNNPHEGRSPLDELFLQHLGETFVFGGGGLFLNHSRGSSCGTHDKHSGSSQTREYFFHFVQNLNLVS